MWNLLAIVEDTAYSFGTISRRSAAGMTEMDSKLSTTEGTVEDERGNHWVQPSEEEANVLAEGFGVATSNPRLAQISTAAQRFYQLIAGEIEKVDPDLSKRMNEMFARSGFDQKRKMSFILASYGQNYFCSNDAKTQISEKLPESSRYFESTLLPLFH